MIEKHLDLLGLRVEDKVTNFTCIVTTLSFDLYGYVQAIVTPSVYDKGETKYSKWFDITRLKILNRTPVMELPNFQMGYVANGKKGATDKSMPSST